MIGSFLAVTAFSHFTAKWVKGKKPKNKTLIVQLSPSSNQTTLADSCHAAIEQKLDRLLGDGRAQQLQGLNPSAPSETSEESKRDNRYLALAALNAGATVMIGLAAPSWLMLTVPVSLALGFRPFRKAWHSLVHERRLNVSVVDSIAIALLAGFRQVTAVSLFLYAAALKLLNKTKQKSRLQLTGMFAQTPATVWVLRREVETEIKLEHLQTDDIVVVRSGEVIPVDGIILASTALIDQRILTGESQPAEKQAGDEVFACTLLLGGRVELQVQSTGQQTVAARIGDILEKTADYKNQHEFHAERFVDRSAAPTLVLSMPALPVSGVSGAIHTCIISGDREIPTRGLAETLGIDQYFANTLPEHKAAIVQRLQDEGRTVCFIGDGINDAIALKQADISVSLKGAATAATDTAQIILMDADLGHLVTLIDMGRQFRGRTCALPSYPPSSVWAVFFFCMADWPWPPSCFTAAWGWG
jgi:cation transport ATPase